MFKETCIKAGQRVLKEEAEAILELVPSIDDSFVKACELLINCKGKVILTGVGKSGHIATKIASTMASTGTQSFFVQAGEAAHGDLGMIGDSDVVIAISNSGEGSELKLMIPLLRRRSIPLIAITGKMESSLARAADVALNAHVSKEACPLNLAPTSSSTAELAIGDALAIALLEARGFTERDFAMSHPGGALGRRLLVRCRDIMHTGDEIPVCSEKVTIKEALLEMTAKNLGVVAVVDEDMHFKGVYTDGDLRRTLEKEVSVHDSLSAVMTHGGVSVAPDCLAADALNIMQQKKISAMIVLDEDGRVTGAFNMHDLLRAGLV
ncbi:MULTISPECIES: KpsF/GutQ family sugar-phosphate isomerase [unclassified Anaerobiospirillum]|uniref:KpsF/GutQ family sugar-phosphate isomerase n=1 Tax=unclassified Anaerobiospirillum TaxID=2647410 RepID=UPI001FF5E13A|nr:MULTISPECIES: KpsF/GutQ family sugar-phosphate isomerase [unclassified Anaerobiospirillum]MCK0525457.1 KpsF/GutQ family sugar-phosphate isomerase [Anaerobiospirillum sp. NML120449]MCK0534127.1 KpsF/GutQ family sugar-phosphate isomerase [Anaerobiospirillum sp. NML120511]MCK0539329.1 KpsF/GutQ family sugar-phosphate isomerase [Anaerobiospirillum sp. NML02-A-032]